MYLSGDLPSPLVITTPSDFFNSSILKPEEVYQIISTSKNEMRDLELFFYKVFKPFIENESKKYQIEQIITQEFEEIQTFEEKYEIGENSSYICSLIRQDSIEDFVSYLSRNNISHSSRINPSICETNSFLIGKNPTLIEYSAFYGSIEIFQYLRLNGVEMPQSLWIYAVHSNNAELIHLLENHVKTDDDFYEEIILESIKCHHNDIANYINMNLLKKSDKTNRNIRSCIANCRNYYFMPSKILDKISKPKSNKRFNICDIYYSLESITIPSSLTTIGESAFNGCTLLERIKIPSSIKSIGISAFFECSSLISITIPSSVISIEDCTFDGCSSLQEVKIPPSVISIGRGVFNRCSSLKEIFIHSTVTSIGENVFRFCSSLSQVTLSNSLTTIKSNSFYCCSSLTKITIPPSVTSILSSTFKGCSSLIQIDIPSSVNLIGSSAFENCSSLEVITIPSSVTSMGFNVFYRCSSLKEVSLLCNIKSIGNSFFEKCISLKQVTIPSSVKSIGKEAFYDCQFLQKVEILSSEISVEFHAFERCFSLNTILIPDSGNIQFNDSGFNGIINRIYK